MIDKLKKIQNDRITKYRAEEANGIDLDTFRDLIKETKDLIKRAFSSQFVIPDFKSFCSSIEQVFHDCEVSFDPCGSSLNTIFRMSMAEQMLHISHSWLALTLISSPFPYVL